jgi:hypothetical protein
MPNAIPSLRLFSDPSAQVLEHTEEENRTSRTVKDISAPCCLFPRVCSINSIRDILSNAKCNFFAMTNLELNTTQQPRKSDSPMFFAALRPRYSGPGAAWS